MFVALIPLMIAGFLALLIFGDRGHFAMFIMLGAGYWCLQLIILVALCDFTDKLKISAVFSFAIAYGAVQIAIILAKPIGAILSDALAGVSDSLSIITGAAVLIIVVLAGFFERFGFGLPVAMGQSERRALLQRGHVLRADLRTRHESA